MANPSNSLKEKVEKLEKMLLLHSAKIRQLTSTVEQLKSDQFSGNDKCPQFITIPNGADGNWHSLEFITGDNLSARLSGHRGYHIYADYQTPGKHSLGSWTVLNTYGAVPEILGGSAAYNSDSRKLELQWVGTTYDFQLQIRSAIAATNTNFPNIRVCIDPLPAKLSINDKVAN
ncbi:hypothetical protein [Pseudobacteriovorax antillogorgiicola]|uniref:hypothetical protein n=1 Tax=Pseudobacteriovorax antillogorgiicola TaxID=1513793 RepID=UPI001051FDE2|nr:hypothetical protein [Pseudobacteriovorax antillogorgiicola]